VLVALAIPAVAFAVSLQPSQIGSSCPVGTVGTYHFVNNQIPTGVGPGTLTFSFTGGTSSSTGPYMVLSHVQHFSVSSTGTLASASTNLPGKLVLSDFSCKKKRS
jgi:hypothetical protein